jgi:multiple sugar transport system permease protein
MPKRLTYALLAAWSFICIFPLYWMFVTSFKSPDYISEKPHYLPFIDFAPDLEAWRFIFFAPNDNLVMSFVNSLVVGFAATVITMVVASMAIYAITRFRKSSDDRLMLALIATRILPPIAMAFPVYMMATWTHLQDTRTALVAIYVATNLPVALWLLRPYMGSRATDQEEAAQLDGASHLTVFFTILLPMCKAGVAAVGLLVFILCWNEYLFSAYLATNHAMTLPGYLVGQMSIKEAQTGSEAEEWAHFSAAAVVIAAPVLLFAGVVQRHLAGAFTHSPFPKSKS